MRQLREDLGLSQADLAEAADLSTQFIAALEQQNRSATLKTVDKLSSALGVTASQLFAAGEKKARPKSAAPEKVARLLDGLTAAQQERMVRALREMRGLVPRRTKR